MTLSPRPAPTPTAPARIRTDFEGANADGAAWSERGHLVFRARADSSPRPLWFYFCLEGAAGPAVTCELENAGECFGPAAGWQQARPVYSADGRHWLRVPSAEYAGGRFRFHVPVTGNHTHVAYAYPYGRAELDALLRPASHPELRLSELCRTPAGLSVPRLRLGPSGTEQPTAWILARQHAGETPGSWVLDGLLRSLLEEPRGFRRLGREVALEVVPLVDLEGVVRGAYGKDQAPVDFNRDWRADPRHPAVAALMRAIRQSKPSLLLDLHASHHGDRECYFFGGQPMDGAALFTFQQRFVRTLAETGPPRVGFRRSDVYFASRPRHSVRDFGLRKLGIPTLTLEMSYHLSQAGILLTIPDYQDFGRALAVSLERIFDRP